MLKDDSPAEALELDSASMFDDSKPRSYGGIVFSESGHVLLRKPAGEFDGYVWTFAKGRPEPDDTQVACAVREVREETGVEAECLYRLPPLRGGTSSTVYWVMRLIKDHGDFDHGETESVRWVTPEDAFSLIAQTRNPVGRNRDTAALKLALEVRFQNTLS